MSFFNAVEAVIVINYINDINNMGIPMTEIGVISPYKKQVEKLKELMCEKKWEGLMVGSTEQFQGLERKAIVISTVRSVPSPLLPDGNYKLGFLVNPKRMNVSITRSRSLLLLLEIPSF